MIFNTSEMMTFGVYFGSATQALKRELKKVLFTYRKQKKTKKQYIYF